MTQELALRNEVSPAEFDAALQAAHLKAQALAKLAEAQKLYVNIGPSKHLRVEGWLTIGRAYGYTTGTGETEILRDPFDGVIGVKATAYVYDQGGAVVGRAEGFCMTEEEQ